MTAPHDPARDLPALAAACRRLAACVCEPALDRAGAAVETIRRQLGRPALDAKLDDVVVACGAGEPIAAVAVVVDLFERLLDNHTGRTAAGRDAGTPPGPADAAYVQTLGEAVAACKARQAAAG